MTNVDPQGRIEPPDVGDELAILVGFLDYQRATLEWKTAGLDAAGLGARLPQHPTKLTLGGLLKHLAYVESDWFNRHLHGNDREPPWDAVDWAATPDWDFESAAADDPDDLRKLWRDTVERSRERMARALAADGLDAVTQEERQDGRMVNLRWILVHMIEEYARHNGHADLLRELVDGETGE
jgi:uncharacterized damage-inducible protein DinB